MLGDTLSLGGGSDGAPRGRRFVRERLRDWGLEGLSGDVELVVSELVTNALLHAAPPVLLSIAAEPPGVRVAVLDASRDRPLRALRAGNGPNGKGVRAAEGMTGRGLALVEAISHRFGVEPAPGGKAVWASVYPAPTGPAAAAEDFPDPGALLDAWGSDDAAWAEDAAPDAEPRFTVDLGDVPTDVLLGAKSHVDNLVRELSLAASGASSGSTAAVPAQLADLIERVVHRFAEVRHMIKEQATRAAEAGLARVHLVVTVPISAAQTGLEYLQGLDEADGYARDARLLTVESDVEFRVFRHWYVEGLVEQLRRAAAGEPVGVPVSFEQRLLAELRAVTARLRVAERAVRLQRVTAALIEATTPEGVAHVMVTEGFASLGASGGMLGIAGPDGRAHPLGELGADAGVVERYDAAGEQGWGPSRTAIATGEPVWVESAEERDRRFSHLAGIQPDVLSLAAVPLIVGEKVLGVLRFSFREPRLFDSDEREYLQALAAQTAHALDRAQLYERQQRTADRLARLQAITAALSAAPGTREVLRAVLRHLAGVLGAESATVAVLSAAGDQLEIRAARGGEPRAMRKFRTFPLEADLPGSEALRTRKPVVVAGTAERGRRYPLLAGFPPEHDRTLICLPLTVQERPLGALTLSLPGIQEPVDEDLSYLTALADACAQSLARARALDDARDAGAKLSFLANASAELGSSLDYQATLSRVAQLTVPSLADWCAVHVLTDGALQTLAVAHSDPDKVAMAWDIERRYPPAIDPASGVGKVLTTGRGELLPEVPDELLVARAVDAEHLQITRELGMSSVIIAPLSSPAGVLGTLTLIRAESGFHYDEADLAVAEDLGRRAGTAIDNARTHAAVEEAARG